MIEELKNTDIVNKVGGRFKLSALIQKRMIELMEGGRPLIEDTEGMSQMEIVVQEIKQDKIILDATGDEKKPATDVL
ncbi:MAG: DNA-directed RNA polymerase subunit omega [Planctomycetota bacterium]|nr:MAG: DNA-directed RNA polymerase subunit omega [Planctomycetota bacterium]RKY12237.1 MAG: DNA-directed RNA polymerase subunit omega [Planctomycetota bacterium]